MLWDIYNPWSIINYLDKRKVGAYWANSSSNRLVNLLIRQGNAWTKTIMEDLIKGGVLETELDEEIIFAQLQKKYGAIWSLLLASGYLKVVEKRFSGGVAPTDITVYDVCRIFPDYMVEMCTEGELQGISFVGRRTGVADEAAPIRWSYEFSGKVNYLPTCVTEAAYGNRAAADITNENYLHEAGLVSEAPSKTTYTDGNGQKVTNLGVHEHWNNSQEKLYSRNLGKEEGIELIQIGN